LLDFLQLVFIWLQFILLTILNDLCRNFNHIKKEAAIDVRKRL